MYMYFLTFHGVAGIEQVFIRQTMKGHMADLEMEL